MGRFITVTLKFSPEAKHAWKWLQTWLIAALTFAPSLYDQFGLVQDYLPPVWFKIGMGVLGFLTLVNHLRTKKK